MKHPRPLRLDLGVTSRPSSLKNLLLPCLSLLLLCGLFTPLAQAEPVTGTVTNKTVNKPSAGDDVVLLQLAQGMQELARTKTDARGHFTIDVPADGLHLLRVTHDKANYFKPIQPGTQSVEMDVFSAAAQVAGVQLDADVMRIETDASGSGLNVVEHFFVKNDSTPATTLMNAHPFELYLPAGATIQGSAAKAPGGMAVQSPLVPEDEPNKYTMIFPIRPGESEFQVSYKISYKDAFTFKPRPVMATDTIAVMMPKAMTFKPGNGSPYSAVTEEMGAQTFVARNVQPSMPLEFTVSGTGQLPRETQTGDTGGPGNTPGAGGPAATGSAAASAGTDTRPGGGLGVPVDPTDTHDPWSKYKWFIIAGLALVFAVGAGIMLRGPSGSAVAASPTGQPAVPPYLQPYPGSPSAPHALLHVLKDESFAIETDRLEGRLSESQYAELKSAMDIVLRRALARSSTNPDRPGINPVS